jgi:primary-amine oxidase
MEEGPKNPHGNGFIAVEKDLPTESQAARLADPSTGRYWKIKNPASLHPVTGKPVAFKLVPQVAPTLLASANSIIAKRGGFATKHLFVTPYHPAENYPVGDWVPQSKGGEGLEKWIQQDRPVSAGNDPVVWHSFGLTHIVRPEDFPVMPYESTGFTLKPVGFFKGNPGIDIPYQANVASKLCGCNGAANGAAVNGHAKGHANGHANGTTSIMHAAAPANGTANGVH